MLESLKRFEIEDFPEMTFILSAVILAVFLFTRTNISVYEDSLGFIPAHPQIYTLTTYLFIHANFTHLIFNLLFLIVAGIAVEETLGPWVFASIFFASGYVSVIFDILGRFLTGFYDVMSHICVGSFLSCVNFTGPFVGASGAIFGLMAVASLVKPNEKVPSILVVLALIPLAQFYFQFQAHYDYFTSIFISVLLGIIAMTIFFFTPSTIPIFFATIAFLFSWIFVILLNASGGVSNVGHLGGVIGGLVSYFVFSRTKRT